MSEQIAGIPAGSILADHTFSCALTTRGGVCDCLPDGVAAAGSTPDPVPEPAESSDQAG